MEDLDNHDKKLPVFLRKIADSIDNNLLLPIQMKKIGEFYMSYLFQEQAIKDNKNHKDEDEDDNSISEYTHDDMIKFLIMGWYIYISFLNNKNNKYN